MTSASGGRSDHSHPRRGDRRAKHGRLHGPRRSNRLAALVAAAVLTAVGGCGQKGPLVLPDEAAAPPPTSTATADNDENQAERRTEPDSRRDGR